MSTVPLVAVRTFPYAGGSVVEGQAFVAQSAQDATLLTAIGLAITAPPAITDDGAADQARTPTRRRRKTAED